MMSFQKCRVTGLECIASDPDKMTLKATCTSDWPDLWRHRKPSALHFFQHKTAPPSFPCFSFFQSRSLTILSLFTMYLHRRATPSASNGSLSRGAIAGIATGVVIFTLALAVCVLLYRRRSRRRRGVEDLTMGPPDDGLIEYGEQPTDAFEDRKSVV